MSHEVINTKYKPHRDMGSGSVDDAAWEEMKAKVTAFLEQNEDKNVLLEEDVRAVDTRLRDQKVWDQMRTALDLVQIEKV